jgi:short-subunit dehydrogenase
MTPPVAIMTGASQGIGAGLVAHAQTARRAVDQALERFRRIDG